MTSAPPDCRCGSSPAPTRRRPAPVHGRHRPPAARRRAVVLRPLVSALRDERSQVEALQSADAPVSVGQTYTHYLPCGDHVGRRAEQRARTAWFHSRGLATTTYFNPMICTDYAGAYDEAVERRPDRDGAGDPYVYHYSTDSQFLSLAVRLLERRRPGVFGELLAEAVADGYDGWMEDFGEYTPLDSRSANGMERDRDAQPLPRQYHCAAQDFARSAGGRSSRFIRSGYTGGALRADRLGRRPDRRLGLRRARLGADERVEHGAVGNQHLGFRHRRLLRDRRATGSPRSCSSAGSSSAPSPG